jgi:glutamine synthetase
VRRAEAGEIGERLEKADVQFVRVLFTDLLGELKSIEIPSRRLADAADHGIAFDGSSIGGYAHIADADMVLIPDLATVTLHPGLTHGRGTKEAYAVAAVIGDVFTSAGDPFPGDPRCILRRFVSDAKKDGVRLFAGAELEFFLFPKGEIPRDGAQIQKKEGYFSRSPVDEEAAVREEIVLVLLRMGIAVEASHHEIVPHIHEIDFEYSDPVTTADRLMLIKFVAKAVANAHGLMAVFMPKPISDFAACGMHVHVSVFRDDRNLFYDPEGASGLSQTGRHFIGGLFDHFAAMTLLTNPTVNSYKRLVPGFEAPVNVAWGFRNRSTLVRIPATGTPETSSRLELRSPDPSANPYLAFTGILAAGLDGVASETEPPSPIEEDVYALSEEEKRARGIRPVPGSLTEAVDALEANDVIRDAIGAKASEYLIRAKRAEIAEFAAAVTDWERSRYLDI